MQFFKKRETLVQNISYMALMAAINVVFVLLTTFIPYLFFLIVFVLPLTSTIVMLFCKKRYFIIYALATLSLCLLITISNIGDTLFYVLPSIITGAVFGLMIKRGINNTWIIIINTMIQAISTYASFPIISLFTGINVIDAFVNLFKLGDFKYTDFIIPVFVFFISLMQIVISFMVVKDEIEKIAHKTNETFTFKDETSFVIISLILIILIITFSFIYGPAAYLSLAILIYFSIAETIIGFAKMNKVLSIVLGVSFVISFFVFTSLYSLIKTPYSLLLIGVFFVLPSLISYTYSLSIKLKTK